jgi:hypothetical protein
MAGDEEFLERNKQGLLPGEHRSLAHGAIASIPAFQLSHCLVT